jgi:hypothetical protein
VEQQQRAQQNRQHEHDRDREQRHREQTLPRRRKLPDGRDHGAAFGPNSGDGVASTGGGAAT